MTRARRLSFLAAAALLSAPCGCEAPERLAGTISGAERARAGVDARGVSQSQTRSALEVASAKQILFGDLHVHTTYSIDAFMYSLPLWTAGEGARPPADACDFARHCAALDFFSINDHAEGLTPELWERTKESIRQCNAVTDPANPDLVAFTGWEWTQSGEVPDQHYGHKNVIFPGTADDELPARPIASMPTSGYSRPPAWLMRAGASAIRTAGYAPYADVVAHMADLAGRGDCEPDVDVRELPPECNEYAETPEVLFEKLRQWGFPTLVVPHGLAWGIHAPPGASMQVQLQPDRVAPDMQRLIEVSSGHGNSEEYRDLPTYALDAEGERICPAPTPDFLPCCWQAGEIIRDRCGDLPAAECDARIAEARQLALEAGVNPHWVIPDAPAEAWLDCDQCRDCFKPAMTLRPQQSAQYAAAISRPGAGEDGSAPLRFRWGFISSTDNHAARPGTGYKQYERLIMSDSRGVVDAETEARVRARTLGEQEDPQRAQAAPRNRLADLFDTERGASFLYPGGVVAVHAQGRDRDAIWRALEQREVYGTSGPRILLWFDLLNAPGADGAPQRAPMGSEVAVRSAPRFEVRAAGDFVQQPGCPADSLSGLSAERRGALCRDECYHPGDARHPIAAIEVVRIRPQLRSDEPVAGLIEDPWRRFECAPDPAGCRVSFEDPDFVGSGRDAVYYVRALQVETPAINAATLRTRFDDQGNAVGVDPCFASFRTPLDEDCLAPASERAWSSPIYVDQPPRS